MNVNGIKRIGLGLLIVAPITVGLWKERGASAGDNENPEQRIARARELCKPHRPCAELVALVPLAYDPESGVEVLTLFAEQLDPRTAGTCAQAAAYGPSDAHRGAARICLQMLARDEGGHAAVQGLAERDPDASLRTVAHEALKTARPRASTQTSVVETGSPQAPESAHRQSGERGPVLDHAARASDPTRVVYTQTGFSFPEGSGAWGAYDLAFHRVDVGITNSLQVGLGVLVPIGGYLVTPQVKYTLHPSEKVHLGIIGTAGIGGEYIGGHQSVGFYGGGAALTLGTPDLFFNAAVSGFGGVGIAGFGGHDSGMAGSVWGILPSVGVSWRATSLVRLNAELVSVLGHHDLNGEIWLFLYGVRLAGDHLFGDVSFVYPFFPRMWDVMKYIPIGFPLLTLGYSW